MHHPNRSSSDRPTVLLVVGLVIVGWLLWDNSIRPSLRPRNFGVVEEGRIYRSGRMTPTALKRVAEANGLRTVIDFRRTERDAESMEMERRTCEALGLTRYEFPLYGDGTGNPNAYLAALRIMTDPAAQPVLVHCSAGAQRTGACVVLYRSIVDGVPLEEAMDEAEDHGHDPRRNPALRRFLFNRGESASDGPRDLDGRIERAFRFGGQVDGFDPVEIEPLAQPPAGEDGGG